MRLSLSQWIFFSNTSKESKNNFESYQITLQFLSINNFKQQLYRSNKNDFNILNHNKKQQMNHFKYNSQILASQQKSSQVRKILSQLSSQKQTFTDQLCQEKLFSIKLQKYDSQTIERHKIQLADHLQTQKWRSSGPGNEEFNRLNLQNINMLSGWQKQRINMAQRSYQNPKQFRGIKYDNFSRQFPKDLSKTYTKGFSKKLRQIQNQYQKKVFNGNLEYLKQKRQKSIDAIKRRGTRFQLSKDKLFGFTSPMKKKSASKQRNTVKQFYSSCSVPKNKQ